MYFAYIDESGDKGLPIRDGSKTNHFTLSVVLVNEANWLAYLNRLIGFRRALKRLHGIPMNAELKSGHFVHGTGPFDGLGYSDRKRMRIYKHALRQLSKMDAAIVWAVTINKVEWEKKYAHLDVFATAWQNMVERLERFTTTTRNYVAVFPDDGANLKVKTILRQLRRYSRPQSAYAGMTLERNADMVLEDPNFRMSHDSYFLQFSDYVAYAASRAVFPEWWCGARYWGYLGELRYEPVNQQEAKQKAVIRGIAVKP